ncbi:hypothetical protein X801_01697 [Opisthorchis viverrini]|uniref:Pyridine nucleotide-disulphide oxidoreductase N-terminal domain-containing protein n=1 Tax=Opisthorchis viverrini TaxID=6198 RepID=A0A1S8X6S4_OPIVI|nr:hypothetical protein X801_01697 [Opisthorchis viverrini]
MEVSKSFQRILTKQGLTFMLNTKVTAASKSGNSVTVTVEGVKDGKTSSTCVPAALRLELEHQINR